MSISLPYAVTAGELPPEEAFAIENQIRLKATGCPSLSSSAYDDEEQTKAVKWDCLLLTAMNEQQKRIFELQLEDIPWQQYAAKCVVIQDPLGVKAGSGGATVWVLKQNREQRHFDEKGRVLLIHSGGYSQRTPHLSNVGKIFMTTPQDCTLLEHKLDELRRLLPSLRPGLFIAASDVLERLPKDIQNIGEDTDCLLLMHKSALEVAVNHGVYVVDDNGELLQVLQKPSVQQMREVEGAIREDDGDSWCFTDSAFFISSRVASALLDATDDLPMMEICAYKDFLRPLGTQSDALADVLVEVGSDIEHDWCVSLNAVFGRCRTELLNCGSNSFFHFGSLAECRRHFYGVLRGLPIPVHSTWEYKVGRDSLVEYCNLPSSTVVGDRSIVSCCSVKNLQEIVIPDDVVVYSTPVARSDQAGWVTVVIGAKDDVKRTFEQGAVQWSGATLRDYEGTTLWDAPLFALAPTADQSLQQSLRKYQHRESEVLDCCGWSMADVVRYVDADKLIDYRRQRRVLWWRYESESPGEHQFQFGSTNQPRS